MNYFGLFFTFMIPGIAIGGMAAAAVREAKEAGHRRTERAGRAQMRTVSRNKLYIHTIEEATKAV